MQFMRRQQKICMASSRASHSANSQSDPCWDVRLAPGCGRLSLFRLALSFAGARSYTLLSFVIVFCSDVPNLRCDSPLTSYRER